jgi:ABC-2 type transport system permease protein
MTIRSDCVAFKTILIKEFLRFIRIWIQTVLPPVITTALYLVIFGGLIGPRIGDMAGIRYVEFIVPGVIMMAVITNSYSNVVSSFYSTKFQRHVEELMVAPVPNWVILAGYVSGGVARGMVVGIAVTGVALFFSRSVPQHLIVTLTVAVLTSILFAIGGFINAIFAKSFDDISIVPTFILTPLTYFGGVFYSIDLLPELWQRLSLANPILYMINAFRYGILGVSDIDLSLAFLIIVLFIGGLSAVALLLLNRGVGIKS